MLNDFATAKRLNIQKNFFIPRPNASYLVLQVANFPQEEKMRELNPIGREDNSLILVSQDGEQFSVSVDDTLMRTLKEHKLPDGSGIELSPRQIQDAIRAGESITEISERSGTRLSLVERFAHPVLEELQHMVDLALSIRVELPADRFNEVAKKPFGEVIAENLAEANAAGIKWKAKRTENSLWEITVNYQLASGEGSATWSFDPRKYLLTPETSNAQSLSKPGSTVDTPLRASSKQTTAEHPAKGDAVITADKLDAFRSRRAKAEAEAVEEMALETLEPVVEAVAAPEEAPEPNPELESEAIAPVIQLTQPLFPVESNLGEESQENPEQEDIELTEEVPIVEAPKKTRAPMPSWDEIVRGTQSDDGEAF